MLKLEKGQDRGSNLHLSTPSDETSKGLVAIWGQLGWHHPVYSQELGHEGVERKLEPSMYGVKMHRYGQRVWGIHHGIIRRSQDD